MLGQQPVSSTLPATTIRGEEPMIREVQWQEICRLFDRDLDLDRKTVRRYLR